MRIRSSPARAAARTSVSRPLSGIKAGDRENDDIVVGEPVLRPQLIPCRRDPVGPLRPQADVDRVREGPHPFRRRAPRHDRVARRSSHDQDTRRRADDARDHGALHHAAPTTAPAQVVALDEQDVRHPAGLAHAIAACEANVLQPEITTTSGRARPSARPTPGVTG